MAKCRSCGAAITWVVNEGSGKREPIDVEPVAKGNIAIVGEGSDGFGGTCPKIRHVQADALPGLSEPKYVSHFATCPQADQHRRREAA